MTDHDLQTQLARLPVPRLAADRRRALAAEVLARADLHDDTRRRPSFVPYAVVAVAAAALAVLVLGRDQGGLGARVEERTPVAVEAAPIAPTIMPSPAEPAQPVVAKTPVVVDEVLPPPTHDEPLPAKARPARQVFGATGERRAEAIDRETRELDGPVAANVATLAFREGWEALRAGRHADAIAAFDRATDPAVVEDATFWAAIAAQRAGNVEDARKRLADFLARFPDSPRADRAREVLR